MKRKHERDWQLLASWAEAPDDVLGLILGRLPTLADRFRFGAVCRPWNTAERRLPRPKKLPWLVLSLPSSPMADRGAFYSLSDKAVYKLPFPSVAGVGGRARVCGAADDWLVVAHGEQGNFLCKPFTGARLPLPHPCTITRSYYPRTRNQQQSEPDILKAVLSCTPSGPPPTSMVMPPKSSPIEPWMPLESLYGEVLFLGGSGSRSFVASGFGGDHADCIYFTNDKYYPWGWEDGSTYLWKVHRFLNRMQEGEEKPCRDIGKFCMRCQSVTFLKELPWKERRSRPTWLYLSNQRR